MPTVGKASTNSSISPPVKPSPPRHGVYKLCGGVHPGISAQYRIVAVSAGMQEANFERAIRDALRSIFGGIESLTLGITTPMQDKYAIQVPHHRLPHADRLSEFPRAVPLAAGRQLQVGAHMHRQILVHGELVQIGILHAAPTDLLPETAKCRTRATTHVACARTGR
jgi:hypothetical protein